MSVFSLMGAVSKMAMVALVAVAVAERQQMDPNA